jgi:hypothetical protein
LDTIVVLPNKRLRYSLSALRKQVDTNILSPEVISIEDFVQKISTAIRTVDPIELLFEFYEVYLSITSKNNQQSFELFANWAKCLQDFNEIDRYLLDANYVLSYLKGCEDIKKWGISRE